MRGILDQQSVDIIIQEEIYDDYKSCISRDDLTKKSIKKIINKEIKRSTGKYFRNKRKVSEKDIDKSYILSNDLTKKSIKKKIGEEIKRSTGKYFRNKRKISEKDIDKYKQRSCYQNNNIRTFLFTLLYSNNNKIENNKIKMLFKQNILALSKQKLQLSIQDLYILPQNYANVIQNLEDRGRNAILLKKLKEDTLLNLNLYNIYKIYTFNNDIINNLIHKLININMINNNNEISTCVNKEINEENNQDINKSTLGKSYIAPLFIFIDSILSFVSVFIDYCGTNFIYIFITHNELPFSKLLHIYL
jgi:hypothetical protein